ncbi:MAG: hypothetical protein ACK55Z_10655, partial [bacterium]
MGRDHRDHGRDHRDHGRSGLGLEWLLKGPGFFAFAPVVYSATRIKSAFPTASGHMAIHAHGSAHYLLLLAPTLLCRLCCGIQRTPTATPSRAAAKVQ